MFCIYIIPQVAEKSEFNVKMSVSDANSIRIGFQPVEKLWIIKVDKIENVEISTFYGVVLSTCNLGKLWINCGIVYKVRKIV